MNHNRIALNRVVSLLDGRFALMVSSVIFGVSVSGLSCVIASSSENIALLCGSITKRFEVRENTVTQKCLIENKIPEIPETQAH